MSPGAMAVSGGRCGRWRRGRSAGAGPGSASLPVPADELMEASWVPALPQPAAAALPLLHSPLTPSPPALPTPAHSPAPLVGSP